MRERFEHVKWQSRICNLKHLFEFTFSCNTCWGLEVGRQKKENYNFRLKQQQTMEPSRVEQGVSLIAGTFLIPSKLPNV